MGSVHFALREDQRVDRGSADRGGRVEQRGDRARRSGEQLVTTARELTTRTDTVSSSIQRALATLGDVANSTDVLADVAGDASVLDGEDGEFDVDGTETPSAAPSFSDQVVGVADQGSRIVQQTMDGTSTRPRRPDRGAA